MHRDRAESAGVSAAGPSRGILAIGAKYADHGKVPVALREIEAVAHDKLVRDLEADEVRLDRHLAAASLGDFPAKIAQLGSYGGGNHFGECEVVHYVASTDGRAVRCVEFEATRKDSLAGALDIVRRFEQLTGFQGLTRSRLSLPQLLFPELRDALSR